MRDQAAEQVATEVEAQPLAAQLDAGAAVAGFAGPALLLSVRGEVIATNADAAPLATLFGSRGDAELKATVAELAATGGSLQRRVRLADAEGERVYDLSVFALTTAGHGPAALAVARDSTLDATLGRALVASRQLFRDLVDCSADFAWETDTDGRFSFVSPKGALGYSAKELNGRLAGDLVDAERSEATAIPFEAQLPVEEIELWLHTADGGAACVRTAARPVRDDAGNWLGARGVCRDITEIKAREMALMRAREREQLSRSIVDSIRTALQPDDMFTAATTAIATALGADQVMIFRYEAGDIETLAAEYLAPEATSLKPPSPQWQSTAPDAIIDHGQVMGRRVISAPCRYQEETKGHLCLCWNTSRNPPPDVADLLHGVSVQIGIVIAQAEIQEKLERLSNTDDLTGLLNRRAFSNAVSRRLSHHHRYGRCGALLYLDLDNFKAVNDTHGHQKGDEALQELAQILTGGGFRSSDIPGRLGGDEFAFWLEETDLEGARHIAEVLLERAASLRAYSGSPDKPLSLSVGIAITDPSVPENLDALLARSDEAMYRAKHDRKGTLVIAPPPSRAGSR